MATPENKVKARVRDYLTSLGAYQLPVQSSGLGEAGHPDRIACINGHCYGIECKADATRKPTALQARRLADLARAGGFAFVVDADNFERWIDLMKRMQSEPATDRRIVWEMACGASSFWR